MLVVFVISAICGMSIFMGSLRNQCFYDTDPGSPAALFYHMPENSSWANVDQYQQILMDNSSWRMALPSECPFVNSPWCDAEAESRSTLWYLCEHVCTRMCTCVSASVNMCAWCVHTCARACTRMPASLRVRVHTYAADMYTYAACSRLSRDLSACRWLSTVSRDLWISKRVQKQATCFGGVEQAAEPVWCMESQL